MRFPAEVLLVLLVLALPVSLVVSELGGPPQVRAATKEVAEAVTVMGSDVAWNTKLLAAERLRKQASQSESEVVSALVKLAGTKDLRLQALACATLGRIQSDASKGELKKIIQSTSLASSLRTAALNALARSGNTLDRGWIDSNVASDPSLESQVAWLKKTSFWK